MLLPALLLLAADAAAAPPSWRAPAALPAGWAAEVPFPAAPDAKVTCTLRHSRCTVEWAGDVAAWVAAYKDKLAAWAPDVVDGTLAAYHGPYSLTVGTEPFGENKGVWLELRTTLPNVLPANWPKEVPEPPGGTIGAVAELDSDTVIVTWQTAASPTAVVDGYRAALTGWTHGSVTSDGTPPLVGWRRKGEVLLLTAQTGAEALAAMGVENTDGIPDLDKTVVNLTWLTGPSAEGYLASWVDG